MNAGEEKTAVGVKCAAHSNNGTRATRRSADDLSGSVASDNAGLFTHLSRAFFLLFDVQSFEVAQGDVVTNAGVCYKTDRHQGDTVDNYLSR